MNQFQLYFNLGIQHILDLKGFDHILFVLALAVVYMLKDWGRILVLVTAFTIGHSLTLALATLNVIRVNTDLVEFLIPVTIAITALVNIFKPKSSSGRGVQINYLFALCFGLIHGLGFSNYLRTLLGKEQSIFTPLLAFNLGLEVGQVVIVVLFLLASTLITGIFRVNRKEWVLVISSIILGMSFMILLDSVYW
ncbi:HupE/UreJ family protein [Cyclobacterium sp. 1_MG-2023]|uniref:HupE/UreJ family protein n=1 Tax=Cyclobacterium sp. 1_MG-2023 TaxID=3062681 RepID=UPI0026E1EE87|nr:HupE/UreJ family protein [Cyclobacterium sp. 1_MG-2023]MDO6439625.1 HupE/UreJ family protein [Cyclobacterium sp. 1_MG-2023]